jgi:hypothetical protein
MSDKLAEALGAITGGALAIVSWWAIAHYAGWEVFAAVLTTDILGHLRQIRDGINGKQ